MENKRVGLDKPEFGLGVGGLGFDLGFVYLNWSF
jgi:hypothetical protein